MEQGFDEKEGVFVVKSFGEVDSVRPYEVRPEHLVPHAAVGENSDLLGEVRQHLALELRLPRFVAVDEPRVRHDDIRTRSPSLGEQVRHKLRVVEVVRVQE